MIISPIESTARQINGESPTFLNRDTRGLNKNSSMKTLMKQEHNSHLVSISFSNVQPFLQKKSSEAAKFSIYFLPHYII